jgi:hypothetical protein
MGAFTTNPASYIEKDRKVTKRIVYTGFCEAVVPVIRISPCTYTISVFYPLDGVLPIENAGKLVTQLLEAREIKFEVSVDSRNEQPCSEQDLSQISPGPRRSWRPDVRALESGGGRRYRRVVAALHCS